MDALGDMNPPGDTGRLDGVGLPGGMGVPMDWPPRLTPEAEQRAEALEFERAELASQSLEARCAALEHPGGRQGFRLWELHIDLSAEEEAVREELYHLYQDRASYVAPGGRRRGEHERDGPDVGDVPDPRTYRRPGGGGMHRRTGDPDSARHGVDLDDLYQQPEADLFGGRRPPRRQGGTFF